MSATLQRLAAIPGTWIDVIARPRRFFGAMRENEGRLPPPLLFAPLMVAVGVLLTVGPLFAAMPLPVSVTVWLPMVLWMAATVVFRAVVGAFIAIVIASLLGDRAAT